MSLKHAGKTYGVVKFVTLEVIEDSLYIRDQIGEYKDRGDLLEQFCYLDFFLQTYDGPSSMNEEGCRGRPKSVKVPYRGDSIHKNRSRILRAEHAEVIPNFPGKWFANRDVPQDQPLFCASMLALLKPWRSLSDLKHDSESFVEAFDHFLTNASSCIRDTVENIQYFHECSESARQRREAVEDIYAEGDSAKFNTQIESEDDEERTTQQDSIEAVIDESQVQYALQHPFSTREALYAQTAMNVAFDKGIFADELSPTTFHKPVPPSSISDLAQCTTLYQTMSSIDTKKDENADAMRSLVDEGSVSAFADTSVCNAPQEEPTVTEIETQLGRDELNEEENGRLHLNDEQQLALNIIRAQLHKRIYGKPFSQLLMVVSGEGGTGKSALLEEITRAYAEAGCISHLAKTAMSGVAATIIGGSTLHSWAGLPTRTPHNENWASSGSREIKARRRRNIIGTWLLGVDEVSMMTAEQLAMLSEARQFVIYNTVRLLLND